VAVTEGLGLAEGVGDGVFVPMALGFGDGVRGAEEVGPTAAVGG
jgi:hypothetical protein